MIAQREGRHVVFPERCEYANAADLTIACLAAENHDLRRERDALRTNIDAIHAYWIEQLANAYRQTSVCREMVFLALQQHHETRRAHRRDANQLRLLREDRRRGGR